MATNVIMPALGVAQQTGTLLKWLKAEGQSVTKGEPLMEIETDKATVEIEAAVSGILAKISAKPGDQVPVGQTIAMILAPGEEVATAATRALTLALSQREREQTASDRRLNERAIVTLSLRERAGVRAQLELRPARLAHL